MRVELPPFEVTVKGKVELVTNKAKKSIKVVSELWCQTGIPNLSIKQEVSLAADLANYLLSDDRLLERWTADLNHMLAGRLMDDTMASHALQGVGIALQLLPPKRKPGRQEKETKAEFLKRIKVALETLRPEERLIQKRLAEKLYPMWDIGAVASYLRRRMRVHGIKKRGTTRTSHEALLLECCHGSRSLLQRVTKRSNI